MKIYIDLLEKSVPILENIAHNASLNQLEKAKLAKALYIWFKAVAELCLESQTEKYG